MKDYEFEYQDNLLKTLLTDEKGLLLKLYNASVNDSPVIIDNCLCLVSIYALKDIPSMSIESDNLTFKEKLLENYLPFTITTKSPDFYPKNISVFDYYSKSRVGYLQSDFEVAVRVIGVFNDQKLNNPKKFLQNLRSKNNPNDKLENESLKKLISRNSHLDPFKILYEHVAESRNWHSTAFN